MQLLYRFSGDERPTPAPPEDFSGDWWAGVYQFGVAAMVAAAPLAAAVPQPFQQQDEIASIVALGSDDAAAPISLPTAANRPPVVFIADDVLPAVLVVGLDEDYWQCGIPPQLWPTAAPPFQADDEPAGSLYGVPEEAYWQNPVVAEPAGRLRYLAPWDGEQHDPGALSGIADPNLIVLADAAVAVPAVTGSALGVPSVAGAALAVPEATGAAILGATA